MEMYPRSYRFSVQSLEGELQMALAQHGPPLAAVFLPGRVRSRALGREHGRLCVAFESKRSDPHIYE